MSHRKHSASLLIQYVATLPPPCINHKGWAFFAASRSGDTNNSLMCLHKGTILFVNTRETSSCAPYLPLCVLVLHFKQFSCFLSIKKHIKNPSAALTDGPYSLRFYQSSISAYIRRLVKAPFQSMIHCLQCPRDHASPFSVAL